MSKAGEAAISVFLEFFAKLASYDPLLNFVTKKQVSQQLKEWQRILPIIQVLLNDAEERQIKDQNIKNWVAELRHLAYDVEDMSAEFAAEALHQASRSKVQNSFSSTWITSFMNPNASMFNKKMISKLEDITSRLNGLATQKGSLGLREMDESTMSKRMKATLQPMCLTGETHDVYGRENEKENLLEFLLKNNGNTNEASVIHITGVGGIGKTTLAQLVYNDDTIKRSFNHRAWICVSKDFDPTFVTKTILKSITDDCCIVPSLNNLQVLLQEKLFGKRFLLVLDNVIADNIDDLTTLLNHFGVGTKVIVTTSFKASSAVSTAEIMTLQQLSDRDCISIFTQQALKGSDFNGHPELEKVGEDIVKKCNGLPLAAKAIGGLLCSHMDYGVWKDISESEIWDLPEEQCGAIPALSLSYHHLPPHLQRCFAYCSLLPKGYEFEEEEIILLWKAEGFLKQTNGKAQNEDLGSQYFRELVSRSFFQPCSRDRSRFIMHDLINDLAQSVAVEICFKLEANQQQKVSESARHSSYVVGTYDGVKKFEPFGQMRGLRTFLPFIFPTDEVCFLTNTVLIDLLPKLRYLRVLSLKGYHITELPDIFGNLINLCYLDFSHTAISSLPDTICNLSNLQTLVLRKCLLEKLPSDIHLLVNLNHLDIRGTNQMKGMPFGIGKLTNLQRLSDFVLGEGGGHQIQEMKNLLHLKGDLALSGLDNIVKAQDALGANLLHKSGLNGLQLRWNDKFDKYTRNKVVEVEVLNMLEPHNQLEKLEIDNYGGTTFPNWMVDSSSLKNLLSMHLHNCRNCKSLPSVGKLPLLKYLCIRGIHDVYKVGTEFFGGNQSNAFASLEILSFDDMPNWKEWDFNEVDDQKVVNFPRLREFYIINCPQLLGRLPDSLICLETLTIYRCPQLMVSVSNLPMLHQLEIDGCSELKLQDYADFPSMKRVSLLNVANFCIPTERLVKKLGSLEYLKINGFTYDKVTPLPLKQQSGSLGNLRSIRSLQILSFPQQESEEEQLQILMELCVNVESLTIGKCRRVNSLPQDLQFLTFLTEMRIVECPCIVSFSRNHLPSALKTLVIVRCVNLQLLVDEKENSSFIDTSLLQHLQILNCPSLLSLCLPTRLQILIVSRCSKLVSLSSRGELPTGLKLLLIMSCLEMETIVETIHESSCLKHLNICDCKNLKSLPRGVNKLKHVERIEILNCQSLVSLSETGLLPTTSLRKLWITECKNLEALPNMQNLLALKELYFSNFSPQMSINAEQGFPTNLTSVSIEDAKLCSSLLKWGLHKLTSLKYLFINGEECVDVVSFPQEETGITLPASLTELTIQKFGNLRYLCSKGFRNLTSLRELWILECPLIEYLPEKEVILSVTKLYIRNCPLLTFKCIYDQGQEWSKLSHIPEVLVDHQSVIPKPSWRVRAGFPYSSY